MYRFIILGLIIVAALYFLFKRNAMLRKIKEDLLQEKEQQDDHVKLVLEAARSNAGRLTVSEASLMSGIKLEEAQTILDELVELREAVIEGEENGKSLYKFPAFVPEEH